jgi:hypothetical protein
MPKKLLQKGVCWKGNWRCRGDRRPCLAYLTGAAMIEGEYALIPGSVAAQPISSLRERSLGIRASLLTQAKFFRYERSCRSPRGGTQLLRLSAIVVSTFIHLAIATPRLKADAYPEFCGSNCNGICALQRRGSPLRLLSCGCFEKMGSRYAWGSCDRATRGHFCLSPPAGSFAYAFADRRLLCSKDWCGEPRFGAVLEVDSPSRVKYAAGPSTTSYGLDNLQRVVETSASESAVLDRARALSINAIVAAMPSVVVELTYDRKGSAKAWCG